MDIARDVAELLTGHPLVDRVELIGSRAGGTAHELSDWDFLVETGDFASLADDLPRLVEPLGPIAAQWDRYADHACYMLMLRGPVKVDLIFPGQPQSWAPPWEVSAETLPAIDAHFWDWILWLEQKRRNGRDELVRKSLGDMFRLLLAPMGAQAAPASVDEALELYIDLREQLKGRLGVEVPRELEAEVAPVVR